MSNITAQKSVEQYRSELRNLFPDKPYDLYGNVWANLSFTQRKAICLMAGFSHSKLEQGCYHDCWRLMTIADRTAITKAINKFSRLCAVIVERAGAQEVAA